MSECHWAVYLWSVHLLVFVKLQWKEWGKERGKGKKIHSLHQKSRRTGEGRLARYWYLLSWVKMYVVPYLFSLLLGLDISKRKSKSPHTQTVQWILVAHTTTTEFLPWPLRFFLLSPVLVFLTSAPTTEPLHVLSPQPGSSGSYTVTQVLTQSHLFREALLGHLV